MGRGKVGILVVGLVVVLALVVWALAPRDQNEALDATPHSVEDEGPESSGQAIREDPQQASEDADSDDDAGGTEHDEESANVSADGATPRPGVAAELVPGELSVEEPADELVAPVVQEHHRALENPTEVDWDSVVAIADDGLLEMIEVSVLEYSELGWSQMGTPELVSSTVLEVDETGEPPTARVELCLDYALVDVVDSAGASMVDEAAETRVRSILNLRYTEGRWIATAQDFTDELAC